MRVNSPIVKVLGFLLPILFGALLWWVFQQFQIFENQATEIVSDVVLVVVAFFKITSTLDRWAVRNVEKAVWERQKRVAAATPKPDKLTVNSAIDQLVESQGADVAAAQLIVRYMVDVPLSTPGAFRMGPRKRKKDGITGLTKEFGMVQYDPHNKPQDDEEGRVINGELFEELVGHYRIRRYLNSILIMHFWKSNFTSVGSDMLPPPHYMVMFDGNIKPLRFAQWDFVAQSKGRFIWVLPTLVHEKEYE